MCDFCTEYVVVLPRTQNYEVKSRLLVTHTYIKVTWVHITTNIIIVLCITRPSEMCKLSLHVSVILFIGRQKNWSICYWTTKQLSKYPPIDWKWAAISQTHTYIHVDYVIVSSMQSIRQTCVWEFGQILNKRSAIFKCMCSWRTYQCTYILGYRKITVLTIRLAHSGLQMKIKNFHWKHRVFRENCMCVLSRKNFQW